MSEVGPLLCLAPVGGPAGGGAHRAPDRARSDRDLNRINPLAFAAAHGRRGKDDRRVPPRGAARAVRDVLERPLPGVRRRARLQRHPEVRGSGRVQLLALRCRIRADPRRDGRGDLHGQPARSPDRRPRPEQAAAIRILSAGVLEFRRRPARRFRRGGSTAIILEHDRARSWREGVLVRSSFQRSS